MTDTDRISRLERICRMQQTILDHQASVIDGLLAATGTTVGTHVLDNQDWRALTNEVRAL